MKKLSLLLLALFSTSAMAVIGIDKDDAFGYAGASISFNQSAFTTSNSATWNFVPDLYYESKQGFIDDNLGTLYVLPYVGVSGSWRWMEVGGRFSELPTGISDRNGNAEFGFTLGTPNVRLTYLHDVMSVHKGQEIQVHVSQPISTMRRFEMVPYLEFSWRDQNLSQHLYGVSASESAASGLDQFNSGASWVYEAGIIGRYDLSRKLIMLSKIKMESHNYDSPIVQRPFGWAVELGISYQFAGF